MDLNMSTQEKIYFANSLSNEDLCNIIAMATERLSIAYVAPDGTVQLERATHVCLNGPTIQISGWPAYRPIPRQSDDYDTITEDDIIATIDELEK